MVKVVCLGSALWWLLFPEPLPFKIFPLKVWGGGRVLLGSGALGVYNFENEDYTSCPEGGRKRPRLMLVGFGAVWRQECDVEGVPTPWDCRPVPLHLLSTSWRLFLYLCLSCVAWYHSLCILVSWFPHLGSDCSHPFTPTSTWQYLPITLVTVLTSQDLTYPPDGVTSAERHVLVLRRRPGLKFPGCRSLGLFSLAVSTASWLFPSVKWARTWH